MAYNQVPAILLLLLRHCIKYMMGMLPESQAFQSLVPIAKVLIRVEHNCEILVRKTPVLCNIVYILSGFANTILDH
jgi:hypothetical protein